MTTGHSVYVLERGMRSSILSHIEMWELSWKVSLTLVALSRRHAPTTDDEGQDKVVLKAIQFPAKEGGHSGSGVIGINERVLWLVANATVFPGLSLYMYGFAERERGQDGDGSGDVDLDCINI